MREALQPSRPALLKMRGLHNLAELLKASSWVPMLLEQNSSNPGKAGALLSPACNWIVHPMPELIPHAREPCLWCPPMLRSSSQNENKANIIAI